MARGNWRECGERVEYTERRKRERRGGESRRCELTVANGSAAVGRAARTYLSDPVRDQLDSEMSGSLPLSWSYYVGSQRWPVVVVMNEQKQWAKYYRNKSSDKQYTRGGRREHFSNETSAIACVHRNCRERPAVAPHVHVCTHTINFVSRGPARATRRKAP